MGDETPVSDIAAGAQGTPYEEETYDSPTDDAVDKDADGNGGANLRKKRRYSLLNKSEFSEEAPAEQPQGNVGPNAQEGNKVSRAGGDASKSLHEEENESACCECEGGGELICCDTCIRAYHMSCLPPRHRPLEDSAILQWSCPVCTYFRVHDTLEQRRGVLMLLQHPIPVPTPDCDPRVKRLRSRKALETASEDEEGSSTSRRNNSTKRFTHQDLFRESHHHYLFEDIKKQRAVAEAGATAGTESPLLPLASSVRATRRATAAAAAQAAEKRSDTSTLSGISSVGRMNVGPAFQVPQLPIPFLETQEMGRPYGQRAKKPIWGEPRVVYSATDWKLRGLKLGKSTPLEPAAAIEPGQLKNQPQQLETDPQEAENLDQDFVDTDEKLTQFCQNLANQWPTRCHWPYSSEYAYKILQCAGFDAKKALDCVADPAFDFNTVCDPPVRPYFNKWRPKDKRSFFPSTPFPPPQHFRAAYGSVGARTRLQAAYGYR